ncbi:uncharacterized protein PV09_07475 [Verruconis gallopava]|uniref:Prokaryotic-type class I peptide chain release factors domain-containing protein n=1 Tax=Verruconis gallopava TaxID=253628 RepID=A0A0D2APA1_9PEZI|nr:uncharacterized protein PV09_07475 [Verruconis gallopava]KIW00949.1 hypothetical protein PV09_07475 [Verruconis gallopava]
MPNSSTAWHFKLQFSENIDYQGGDVRERPVYQLFCMFKQPWVCASCLAKGFRVSRRVQRAALSNISPLRQADVSSATIYPALLSRARRIAAEHKLLSKQLENDYSLAIAKKAGALASIVDELQKWEKANESLRELQELLRDPATDAELKTLASEDLESTVAQLHGASQSLTASLVPKHPFADLPCLIEIRPGAGGSEAGLFAHDLLQMYKGFCSSRGLRATVLEEKRDDGTNGMAIVEAVLSVESPGAYGILRCEAGVHRVQRVPETEKMGRTHTSSASVMVLPSFSDGAVEEMDIDDPKSDFYVDPSEVRVDVMRASGAGGQHVNRTESAVRLTHIPTNTVVSIQTGRSQLQNRKTAWEILRARLAQSRREKREEEMLAMRRSVVGVAKIGRGDKIRTYNWSQQRVTDHRSGLSVHGIDGIMAGGPNLEKLMDSVRKWMVEKEVESMIAEVKDNENGEIATSKSPRE